MTPIKINYKTYLPAKELAGIIGRNVAWIYYHSASADGPIRRTVEVVKTPKGRELTLTHFHVEDCRSYSEGYVRGVNAGKNYPRSIVQQRLASPEDLRFIETHSIHAQVSKAVEHVVENYRQHLRRRGRLKAVAGGRK